MTTRLASLFYDLDRLKERVAPLVDRADALRRALPWRRDFGETAGGLAYEHDPAVIGEDATGFAARLRAQVLAHPALNHPLLARVVHVPFVREDFRVLALQLQPLVGHTTTLLERLLTSAPDAETKQSIARVLVERYGEAHGDGGHAALYRTLLRATGATEDDAMQATLHPAVTELVTEHRRIVVEEPFFVALGAVGPGHEWSVPGMYEQLVHGLRRASIGEAELRFFVRHVDDAPRRSAWVEPVLVRHGSDREARAAIQRGAMRSLAAWVRLWTGVQNELVRWRQPRDVHVRGSSRHHGLAPGSQPTMARWRARMEGGKA